jgi:hypothetical protein
LESWNHCPNTTPTNPTRHARIIAQPSRRIFQSAGARCSNAPGLRCVAARHDCNRRSVRFLFSHATREKYA